ncbi:hypothetical protein U3A55_02380 [Salarchaeum sp. III]|uniref:hypothetical protein n=1 Tax=Salarchaeum sp. III TaxID=3107927 RepID=UPI002ED8B11E
MDMGERKVRSDKKERVGPSLDQDTHNKLRKLAISCEMTKTQLSADIIKLALNHPDIIKWYQDKYNQEDQYRVVPIKHEGKIHY